MENLDSQSHLLPQPLYGSNWGHNIAYFVFYIILISPLLLLLLLQNLNLTQGF